MEPRCPLCGAASTWVGEDKTELWRKQIPDDCHFCKEEDYIHWKDWEQGIDVTQFGGGPLNANVETPRLRRRRRQVVREW